MKRTVHWWHALRWAASRLAAQRAMRAGPEHPATLERWLRLAAALAPAFAAVHRDVVAARHRAGDRLGALAAASRFARRFEHTADAWVLLGEASVAAFRPDDAIAAFERALAIEERPDAALAAGDLYARKGDPVTAGARYARAYAAGAGPRALELNAKALRAAGDLEAWQQARALWERETGRVWVDD
jgi:tetratricopeptide (TPR) repeat protein